MVDNIVDLVGCILLSTLALLVGSCSVGSIVAALRAVGRGSVTVNARKRANHGAETIVSDDRIVETGAMLATIAGSKECPRHRASFGQGNADEGIRASRASY
jgi:hypothetical protein